MSVDEKIRYIYGPQLSRSQFCFVFLGKSWFFIIFVYKHDFLSPRELFSIVLFSNIFFRNKRESFQFKNILTDFLRIINPFTTAKFLLEKCPKNLQIICFCPKKYPQHVHIQKIQGKSHKTPDYFDFMLNDYVSIFQKILIYSQFILFYL